MNIHLVIKGNEPEARQAAEVAGVPLLLVKPLGHGAVVAQCEERYRSQVVEWFCKTENHELQEGYGYPDGTLLFHR